MFGTPYLFGKNGNAISGIPVDPDMIFEGNSGMISCREHQLRASLTTAPGAKVVAVPGDRTVRVQGSVQLGTNSTYRIYRVRFPHLEIDCIRKVRDLALSRPIVLATQNA